MLQSERGGSWSSVSHCKVGAEGSGCFCLGAWLCFLLVLYLDVGTFSPGWALQGRFPFRFGVGGFLLYFFLLFLLLFTACLQLIHVLRRN